MVVYQLQNEFPKKSISPGEPRPGEIGGVVFVERLVHEAGACSGIAKPEKAMSNFPRAFGS